MLILAFDPAPVNMSYCLMEYKTKKIIDWKLFRAESCKELVSTLKSIKLYGEVIILYEHQPPCRSSFTNLHKIVGYIEMYYTMENPNYKVKLIKARARSGINYMKDMNPEGKLSYSDRKSLVVKKCRKALEITDNNSWIDFFDSRVKADDLSDSMIICTYYIHKN